MVKEKDMVVERIQIEIEDRDAEGMEHNGDDLNSKRKWFRVYVCIESGMLERKLHKRKGGGKTKRKI